MGAETPNRGDLKTEQSAPAHTGADWLAENVGKPLYNSAVAGTWNWVANIEHLGGLTPEALQLPKIEDYKVQTAPEGSLGWLAQGAASTVGSLPGFIASTYLTKGILGRIGKGLEAFAPAAKPLSTLLTDARVTPIVGASLFGSTRDLQPGESRESAIINSTVNMAAFSLGSPYLSKLGAWRLAAYPALGAVSGPVSLELSQKATTGSFVGLHDSRLWSASLDGAVFTGLLPLGFHAAGKAAEVAQNGIDALNIQAGRGIPVSRFIDRYGLSQSARDAVNARLPAAARFTLSTGLDTAAAEPEAARMRVQPIAPGQRYTGPYSPTLIPLEQIERGVSQLKPPEVELSAQQQAARNAVVQKTIDAQLLSHEINSRVDAARGRSPAILSSIGFWKALHDGDIRWARFKDGRFVPSVPNPLAVGDDAVDLHLSLDGEIAVPPKGQTFDLTTDSANNIIANTYTPKIVEGKIALGPGEKFLGWTDEAIGLEAGKYVGFFENVSSNARLFFSPHTDASIIHSGEMRRVVVEVLNSSDNTIVLQPGQKIGQIMFLRKGDGQVESLQNRSTKNQVHFNGERMGAAGTTSDTMTEDLST